MFSANTSQVSADQVYVEDVFSTYLYTGTPAYAQTIVNGIDLAGKGGLLWIKSRTSDTAPDHYLNFNDGSNIVSNQSNNTSARQVMSPYVAFNSNGFYVNAAPGFLNNNGVNYTSWTFRKAPKFFDVVTYTGNGSTARAISHSLGVAPGSMFIKRTDSTGQWVVYHRSLGNSLGLILESTIAQFNTNTFGYTTPDATTFTVGDYNNINGATYVAYLFAHDTTSDGIIQCGSYTGNGSSTGPTVTLGWEPQWLLVKGASGPAQWYLIDNMRGMALTGNGNSLYPNTSQSENQYWAANFININSTGFQVVNTDSEINASGSTYIYIAIRRGPMRTPTSGTSVFAPITWSGTGTNNRVITGAPTASDSILINTRNQAANYWNWNDRLRGAQNTLYPYTTSAENAGAGATYGVSSINMDGFTQGSQDGIGYNASGATAFAYFFKRAPSFFDEVCLPISSFSVNGNHNLGVAPEMIIGKRRDSTGNWFVYHTGLTGVNSQGKRNEQLLLNSDAAKTTAASDGYFVDGLTATSFETYWWPSSSGTAVLYLFASCPGVSKVGSYTGNGSSQTINCGFAAGARFVMIKRTDSTGDWYVWDTARGIVSGNDPHLSLNTTAAEVTTDDSVDTDSSGFVVNQLSATNINVSSATYIYLAVA